MSVKKQEEEAASSRDLREGDKSGPSPQNGPYWWTHYRVNTRKKREDGKKKAWKGKGQAITDFDAISILTANGRRDVLQRTAPLTNLAIDKVIVIGNKRDLHSGALGKEELVELAIGVADRRGSGRSHQSCAI